MDQTLDLVIWPNLQGHFWKDEDEFQWGIEAWLVHRAQGEALRAIGASVLEDAKRGAWPFADGWERWRPDGALGLPVFPEGWDRLE